MTAHDNHKVSTLARPGKQGFGNTNNDLGSRATVVQAAGYSVIIHDTGSLLANTLPNHEDNVDRKVAQRQFYKDYLDWRGEPRENLVVHWRELGV